MRSSLTVLIILFLLSFSAIAQQEDILVGDVEISALQWGKQSFDVDLTNQTEYPKFIVSTVEIIFDESYLENNRKTRSSAILMPGEMHTINPTIVIPGGFGKATISLKLYDVVDTLDEVLDYQLFYEQPFFVNIKMPESAIPYYQNKVTFPPQVDQHPYYASEFSRIFIQMLGEGKSLKEIIKINKTTSAFVSQTAKLFQKYDYVKKVPEGYQLHFPVILQPEAEAARKIAEQTADKLATTLATNLPGYWPVVDSLIAAKAIPADSNDFVSGATLIYQPYPVLSVLTLWFDLGKKFITRSAPLKIFDGSTICLAGNHQYMYGVVGGDYFNGTHLFGYFEGKNDIDIVFSEHQGSIVCHEDFLKPGSPRRATWYFSQDSKPEYFIIDTVVVRPLINRLAQNCDPILVTAYDELKANAIAHGHAKASYGHRYWFWNLVATLTVDKLIKEHNVERRGNGVFRFDSIYKRK